MIGGPTAGIVRDEARRGIGHAGQTLTNRRRTAPIAVLEAQPAGGARDPPAAADVGGPLLEPGDGQHPLDGGRVGRVALVGARRAATRARPRRASAGGAAASAGGVGRVDARRPRRPSRSTASRASAAWRASTGTTSRPATSASSGSTSWRTRLRRNAGSSFDGSSTTSRPSARRAPPSRRRRRRQDRAAGVGAHRRPGRRGRRPASG